MRNLAIGALSALVAVSMLSTSARADVVVLNGSFEDTPTTAGGPFDGLTCASILTPCVTVPHWTTQSDVAVLLTTGIGGNTSIYLDGGSSITAADGANFIGTDGSCCTLGPLTQMLSLTAGDTYVLSFEYAAAQLSGNFGDTTEAWVVTIGGSVVAAPSNSVLLSDGTTTYPFSAYIVSGADNQWQTPVLHNTSGGFTGWSTASFTFKANSSSELLGFLAIGTPIGPPPFVLLDNVSVVATPEPAGYTLLGAVLLLLGLASRRRLKQARLG